MEHKKRSKPDNNQSNLQHEDQDSDSSLILGDGGTGEQRPSYNPMEEDIRLTKKQVNLMQRSKEIDNQQPMTSEDEEVLKEKLELSNHQKKETEDSPRLSKAKAGNIFGRSRNSQKNLDKKSGDEDSGRKTKTNDKLEREFERKSIALMRQEEWAQLEDLSRDHLSQTQYTSYKGYFYLGLCFYKQGDFENAIKAFKEAETINPDDSQLHYNLGLSYFKLELYNPTVEHWRKCIKLDPTHRFVYNNLAFLFNLHQFYPETINICGQAKLHVPEHHNCYRHWAFALFKKGEMTKAVKKIKKGIQKCPKDADNWIMWGVILRYHGNYKSAKHKFQKALKLDSDNETASEELQIIDKIIELDQQIPLDEVPAFKKNINKNSAMREGEEGFSVPAEGCARQCSTSYFNPCGCVLF